MSAKKIFGIAVVVIGAILVFFSDYIAKEVAAGRMQIREGRQGFFIKNFLTSK